MNQSSFTIRKSKLLNELKNISKALGRISRANMKIVNELTVIDGFLTIVIPGAKLELECETKSTEKTRWRGFSIRAKTVCLILK